MFLLQTCFINYISCNCHPLNSFYFVYILERKAKQAEQQIREIARKAREACRRDEKSDTTINPETTPTSPQPPNRQAVLDWYKQQEVLRKAGIDQYNNIEPWFHGNYQICTRLLQH